MFQTNDLLIAFYQQNKLSEYEEIQEFDKNHYLLNRYAIATQHARKILILSIHYQTFIYVDITKQKEIKNPQTIEDLYHHKKPSTHFCYLIHLN